MLIVPQVNTANHAPGFQIGYATEDIITHRHVIKKALKKFENMGLIAQVSSIGLLNLLLA